MVPLDLEKRASSRRVKPRTRHAVVAVLLVILVGVAYAPTLGIPFVSDDYTVIRLITQPEGNIPTGLAYWTQVFSEFYANLLGSISQYRPVYMLTFGLDYALYGTDSTGYHVTNLLFHAAGSFSVYLLALELVPGERRFWAAVTAGVLFAIYPINPGAVSWPAGRADVLCGAFFFPVLIFFLRWLRTERRLYLGLGLAFLLLALWSKETAAVLPGLLFFCAIYRRRNVRNAVLLVAPFALLLGTYLAIRHFLLLDGAPNYVSTSPLDIPLRLQGVAYGTYQMFVPINISLLSNSLRGPLHELFLAWPVLVLAALAAAYLLYRAGKLRLPLLLVGLYALPLLPVFRALGPNPEMTSGRWYYLSSAFVAILTGYLLWSIPIRWGRFLPAVASAVVCAAFLGALIANNSTYLRAGELAAEHLESGEAPREYPVRYKGAFVFGNLNMWNAANRPPFDDLDCSDYPPELYGDSQRAVQIHLKNYPPRATKGLDTNGNGIACD